MTVIREWFSFFSFYTVGSPTIIQKYTILRVPRGKQHFAISFPPRPIFHFQTGETAFYCSLFFFSFFFVDGRFPLLVTLASFQRQFQWKFHHCCPGSWIRPTPSPSSQNLSFLASSNWLLWAFKVIDIPYPPLFLLQPHGRGWRIHYATEPSLLYIYTRLYGRIYYWGIVV